MIKQAVILAGGEGKRLRPFTLDNAKPMISINGKPFLWHLIELLKQNGIEEVVVLTGCFGEKIKKYFGDGSNFGIKIKYSQTPFRSESGEENESGIRLKNAESLLASRFLLMYCDNYWPLQISKLEQFYTEKKTDVSLVAYSNKDGFTKNNLLIEDGIVARYDKNREEENLNAVDIGFFIIDKKVFGYFPEGNFQFERDILPKLVVKKRVAGYVTDHRYYSIGKPERLEATEKFLKDRKIIFLDRDGVINKKAPEGDYVKSWKEFEFLPGSVEALELLAKRGVEIYLISNQAGVSRGVMKKEDLEEIHKNMNLELAKRDIEIRGAYFCCHGWDDNCECRKPKPGMLFQAAREHCLNLSKSVFIGDDQRDMLAGAAAGCRTILVDSSKNLLTAARELL